MPSVQSIEVKEAGWIWRGYLNQLSLNTTWNLFSPDPATAMFMRLSLLQEDEEKENIELTLPSFGSKISWNPTKRRELYLMRYLLLDSQKVENYLIPWYCKQYPGTREVTLESIGTQIPTLEEARKYKDGKITDLYLQQSLQVYRGFCER